MGAPNPSDGGDQPIPDGTRQTPGGWNRFSVEVNNISQIVSTLKNAGAHFRNKIVTGVGGKQIIIEDPSGNPIELFEPLIESARF